MLKEAKRKVGRPSKYNPIYCKKLVEFFDIEPTIFKDMEIVTKKGDVVEISKEEPAPIPWFSGFCKEYGINGDTLVDWAKKYPEFTAAYKKAKQLQVQFISTNALRNNFNGVFAIFMLKNTNRWQDEGSPNWGDRVEHTGKDGEAIDVNLNIKRQEIVHVLHEMMAYKGANKNGEALLASQAK